MTGRDGHHVVRSLALSGAAMSNDVICDQLHCRHNRVGRSDLGLGGEKRQ